MNSTNPSVKLFAIKDIRANIFDSPMIFKNSVEALRAFETVSKDSNTKFSKFPNDYALFEIGKFDEVTGILDGSIPLQLSIAADYLK